MANWSIGQVRAQDVGRAAAVVALGIDVLLKKQNEDGSWGSDHPLDRVVATCHSVMALLSIGVPATDPAVSRGLEFLASGYVDSYQWGFWRVAPMLGIPRYAALVQSDLSDIERRIETHSGSPSPEQPLTTFIARAYECLGDQQRITPHLESILASYSPETAWLGRAAATTHALSVLLDSDKAQCITDEMFRRCVELVAFQANRQGFNLVNWEGRVTSTSYIAMNILECGRLASDARIAALLPGASEYLISRQSPQGLWPVESPPYGGDLEIVAPDYYSAVALRGIVAIHASADPSFLSQVWYQLVAGRNVQVETMRVTIRDLTNQSAILQKTERRRRALWQLTTAVLLCVLLIPQAISRIPGVASSLGLTGRSDSDIILGRYGSYASLIALVITVLAWGPPIYRWARRRLRSAGRTS